MKTTKPHLLRTYARVILFVFVIFAFLAGPCRKPGKGKPGEDDDGGVQPMYGIKTSIFKVLQ